MPHYSRMVWLHDAVAALEQTLPASRCLHCAAGSDAELSGGAATPQGGSVTPSRGGSPAPDAAKAVAAAAGYVSCWGMASGSQPGTADEETVAVPPTVAEEEEPPAPPQPLLPAGITGIKNIGACCLLLVATCRLPARHLARLERLLASSKLA